MKSKQILFLFIGILLLVNLVCFVSAALSLNYGDVVEVYSTGSSGLLVRDPNNACGNVVGGEYDGAQGTVISGPAYCSGYNRWKISWSDGVVGWSAENWLRKVQTTTDNLPVVNSFKVSPLFGASGNAFTISYSVSDDIRLYSVQLWRANEVYGQPGTWNKIKEISISGKTYSDSFSDTPLLTGVYWYGVHVNDNSGNLNHWNDEKNSQTGGSPGVYGPIKISVVSSCVPKTCSDLGKNCGAWDNECQQSIDCGSCVSGKTCSNGQCVSNSVTLTLYMYENSLSGAILPGTRITGYDSSNQYFDVITNSNGYATITGGAGTWSFTASKTGYETSSWTKSIQSSTTNQGYLIKSCTNACSSGDKTCLGNMKEICNDFNGDGCSEWGGGVSCSYGCAYGECLSQPVCTPNCNGKQCGDNGCGGSCGSCSNGQTCNANGQCISSTTSVTLSLYMHDGSINGAVIQGIRVIGTDASKNSFDKTTDSNGLVSITGTSGEWSFTASKTGYQTVSWSQSINTAIRRDGFLLKEISPVSLVITSPLKITPEKNPYPYSATDNVSAQFKIKNIGTSPVTLSVITVGGRDPNNMVFDFSWANEITIQPNTEYIYNGQISGFYKTGSYHFFCTYRTQDGNWNTNIDLSSGFTVNDREKNITIAPTYYLSSVPLIDRGGIVIPKNIFPDGEGKMIPVYVPSVIDNSNIIRNEDGWTTVKNIEKAYWDFSFLDFFLGMYNIKSSEIPKEILANTAMQSIISFIDSTSVDKYKITIQQKGTENIFRAIIQQGGYPSPLKNLAGTGEQVFINPFDNIYYSDTIAGAFHLEPCSFPYSYWLIGSVDATHKNEEYLYYISVTNDSRVVLTPKIYSGDYMKVKKVFDFNPFDQETVVEINGEGYTSFFSRPVNDETFKTISKRLAPISIQSKSTISVQEHSSGELRVYDSNGNVTGIVNGIAKEEIPFSIYDNETKTVLLFNPTSVYHYNIVGTTEGTYGLTISSIGKESNEEFNAVNIPISNNTVYQYQIDWNSLSQGGEGVTVSIDSEGDGTFEQTILTGDNFQMNNSSTCTPNWNCGSWSSCVGGQQTRTCTDSNNCGTNNGKSVVSQSCNSNTSGNSHNSDCSFITNIKPAGASWTIDDYSAPNSGQQKWIAVDVNNDGKKEIFEYEGFGTAPSGQNYCDLIVVGDYLAVNPLGDFPLRYYGPDRNNLYVLYICSGNKMYDYYQNKNIPSNPDLSCNPVCTPNCNGKQCGDNECGGSCGNCSSGQTCNANGQCTNPLPICQNQCDFIQSRCNGKNSETCNDFNGDGCLEWGDIVYCDNGCHGKGFCNICIPNSRYCNENQAMMCSSDGSILNGISCGNSYCDNFGDNYCKNGNVYHSKTCYDKGCSNGGCFNNQRIDEQLVQTCSSGQTCSNGQCINNNPGIRLVSSSAPVSTNLNNQFQIKCDFGAKLGCIQAYHNGVPCAWANKWEGTAGVFNCVGTKSGIQDNYCNLIYWFGDSRCFTPQQNKIQSTNVVNNICIINCNGKQCGDNGCGGSCGTCSNGQTCNANGQCINNNPGISLVSSSAPISTNMGESFQIKCDYGAVLPCIIATSGGQTCSYLRFDGTSAVFNCNAKTLGNQENYCNTFIYLGDKRCSSAQQNKIQSTNVK